jgi:hypothetical protein
MLNKRELRKHADPGLNFSPGNGLLYADAIDCILRSAVKNIAGRRVLLLYAYRRKSVAAGDFVPLYTVFQVKEDYATLEHMAGGALKWRSASLWNLLRIDHTCMKCAFYTQKDEQRITRFCGIPEKTGRDAVEALQEKIMAARLEKRLIARERKIVERMKSLRALPRDMASWLHCEALPAYIFYKYHRGSKPMAGYCTACRNDVSVSGAKHGKNGVCPRCGRAVVYKAEGRAVNVWDRVTAQTLERTGDNELVLRIIKAHRSYRDYRNPKTEVWENARFFIRWDAAGAVAVENYYYSYGEKLLTNWKRGYRPQFSHWQTNFEADICGYLYNKNLGAALRGTPWQYSQLGAFYFKDPTPLEVMPYMNAYTRYPFIEYLVKLGLMKLTVDVVYNRNSLPAVNIEGKNLREILGVGTEDLPLLQRLDADRRQLELYKALKQQGLRCDETLLRWYAERKIHNKDDVLYPLRYMTALKLMRYAEEQFEHLKGEKTRYAASRYEVLGRVLSEYKDYLRMGRGLDYDLTSSFVLFPRDLKQAHDQAVALYDEHKAAIYNKLILAAYQPLLERYGFTKYGFTMLPPKSAEEIVREGHALHHCVGTYAGRVAKEECIILFLRRADAADEPFVTVELRNGEISQTRGQNNCVPPPEVKKFLELWERQKLLTGRTSAAA